MEYKPGQTIGNRAPTVQCRTDNGGTKYSPGLVQTVPVRRYDRAGTDWRIWNDGSGIFVGSPKYVPSDRASYLGYLDAVRTDVNDKGKGGYDKDFAAVAYGRPRSGRRA